MKQYAIITFVLCTTLIGCNVRSDVKENVESGVKNAKVEMENDISNAKSVFEESIQQILKQSKDSSLSARVINLHTSINKTSLYIDSLRAKTEEFENMSKSTEMVKQLFVWKGAGDSVFNKVKVSYSLAIDIAAADTTKTRLRKVKETYNEETKNIYFEMTMPIGVNMILYGIESELLKDASKSLVGYTTK